MGSSPLSLPDSVPTAVTVEEKEQLLLEFQERFNIDSLASICGSCGCLYTHVGPPVMLGLSCLEMIKADVCVQLVPKRERNVSP